MEWSSEGVILSVRPHGETSGIVELLTPDRGRHAGLVRGARSKRLRGELQPGNRIRATWKARLSEHLGLFQTELTEPSGAALLEDRLALSGLNAACALASALLPEREPHSAVYDAFSLLVEHLPDIDVWPALMVRFEAGLLADLGYGLDLSKCAASGVRDELVWVSPNTGRAVSAEAGEPYRDKLLVLPPFLLGAQAALRPGDVEAGFRLTGWFLERRILWLADRNLPEARAVMLERLSAAGRI